MHERSLATKGAHKGSKGKGQKQQELAKQKAAAA